MKEISGDIWECDGWKVITTNGVVNKDGMAIMGGGIAKQASERFPGLRKELGKLIDVFGNEVYRFQDLKLFTFPTKSDWKEESDISLIERSCVRLLQFVNTMDIKEIYMVRPGCGKGNLKWSDVKNVLEKYFDDRFIIVEKYNAGVN